VISCKLLLRGENDKLHILDNIEIFVRCLWLPIFTDVYRRGFPKGWTFIYRWI